MDRLTFVNELTGDKYVFINDFMQHVPKRCPRNIDDARDFEIKEESDLGRDVNDLLSIPFSESEARALLYKTRYQQENEDNIWK